MRPEDLFANFVLLLLVGTGGQFLTLYSRNRGSVLDLILF